MRAIVSILLVAIVSPFAFSAERNWVDLFPKEDPWAPWRTNKALWVEAKDAKLNPENDRRIVYTPGKGVFVNGAVGRAPNLVTKEKYTDLEVHVEFLVSKGSNAGVKLMGVYEIQILDSYGVPKEKLTGSHCGGIYPRGENRPRYHTIDKGRPPNVNAAKPAGEWQTLDIVFQAPRFDGSGKKLTNARFLKVTHNGRVIHEDVEVLYPTGAAWRRAKEHPTGPLLLQADHGPVAYRNVRIRPLDLKVDTTPTKEIPFEKNSYTYKTIDETPIQADVYRHEGDEVRPCVVWIHGGALITGSRRGVPRRLLELCKREGFVLVSLDYRLAPEVKAPAILEDIEDAFRWLRSEGPKRFAIDPNRVVVTGGSAGGYLTLVTGYRVKPAPEALVAYWGYGDIDGEWYTKPSSFYREKTPLISKEEAFKAVGNGVITGTTTREMQQARGKFYRYLRQNGLWTEVVTGFDPKTQSNKLDSLCPVRNIGKDYPPTLLLHGTDDNDVPYEQSVAMDKALTQAKIPHQLLSVPKAGHGLAGGDKGKIEQAHLEAESFIIEHLLK